MTKTINLTLSIEETNLLLKALSKLPLEEALNTFAKIKGAAEEQLKPEPEPQPNKQEEKALADTESF